MKAAVSVASLALASIGSATLVIGCGGSSGGSSGGSFSSTTSTASTQSQSVAQPTPPPVPVVTITSPARGAFLPTGPVTVTGNVTTGTGLASIAVQNVPITADAQGNFTTTVTLDEGVDAITITAIDNAGNRTDRTLSVETGNYLPATGIVPGAFAGRVNAGAFALIQKLAQAQIAALQSSVSTSLQSLNPVFSGSGFDVSIASVSFGNPTITVGSSTQGLTLAVTIPQVVATVDVSAGGAVVTQGTITADSVTINATAQLGITQSGAISVTIPTVNVAFQNFNLSLQGALSFLSGIAGPAIQPFLTSQLQTMIQTDAPQALAKIITQSMAFSLGSTTLTFSYALESIATDADGISFSVGVDLTLPPDPTYPPSPGSLDSPGALPATFSNLPTAVFSLSETAINRALQQAWQAGMLEASVAPGALAQSLGVTLPFGTTAQDLANFFPDLQGVIPQNLLAAPIVFTIRSSLPPTAKIMAGVPDPLRLRFGEYLVTASIDTGGGQLMDVFTVSLFAEVQLGITIQNGNLVPDMTTLPSPIVKSDLVSTPLVALGAAHIQSYLDAIIPALSGGLISRLPPIPVPALPAGLTLTSATIHADGSASNYLTLELELQ